MNYDWILFDADETLFRFDSFAGLKRLMTNYRRQFTEQDYREFQAVNQPLWQRYQNGEITAATLQRDRFLPLAAELSTDATELNEQFLTAMADICELLPGAKELVTSLHGKVGMGIITNGFTDLQQVRLERTGLDGLFDFLVISEQVGVAKPDPAIFHHAFDLMPQGKPANDRILMVGDNPESDIRGGLNAGIHTCWLRHDDHSMTIPTIRAHLEVNSLSELQRHLAIS